MEDLAEASTSNPNPNPNPNPKSNKADLVYQIVAPQSMYHVVGVLWKSCVCKTIYSLKTIQIWKNTLYTALQVS